MKIGLLGGTFNPIHIGHMAMAQVALERLKLDKVIFIPSNLPPHKSSRNIPEAEDRYRMVELSIAENPRFEVSDAELLRGGKSYTLDTVKTFKEMYPAGTKLYFLIGGDSLESLPEWKNVNELKKLVTFVALNRPGYKVKQKKVKARKLTMPNLEISSSYLRKCFREGGSAKYLIRQKVGEYIHRKKLYGVRSK